MKNIGSSTSQNCNWEISPRNALWVKFGKWKKKKKVKKIEKTKNMIHNGEIKEKKRGSIGGHEMMLMLDARTDAEVRKCTEQKED